MSDFVVCPHCQGKNRDLWDHDWSTSDVVETDCGHCGKEIAIGRNVSVSYHILEPARATQNRRETDDG